MAVRQRITVSFDGHVIGEGFNSKTVERVGTGLNPATVGEDSVAPGQSADFKFQMLTSQDSLEKALNVGAQVDARYGLFSGGAKFSFAENSAINTMSTYILASCVVTNARRFGSGFTPTPEAQPLIDAGDRAGFMTAFGDRFTQALHTGGEFHAIVRVTSSDTRHQQQISASLHGELNGLVSAVSFQAALSVAEQDAHSTTEVDIQIHQTGGVGAEISIPGTDADKIRQHMDTFAAAAHAHAAAFAAELVTYDTLALPFPSEEEEEERRQVLEDCLVRRQQYWSAISDLTFAQTKDAGLILENLPPREQLLALQNEFRRVLNDLMAHARRVADGTIPPAVFVATNEPLLPIFRRRTAGSFASWWKRFQDNDATLLQDERILIAAIASQAASSLTVPIEQAQPEAVERAANLIESLDLATPEPPHLTSMANLPGMISAPLRGISAEHNELDDLAGIESFSRLESFVHTFGRLRDIGALASAAGLTELFLTDNSVEDLGALRVLNRLQTLHVPGNEIRTLEPIRGLPKLTFVVVAGEDLSGPIDVVPDFRENPIIDARALGELPHLACPLTTQDRLHINVFDSPNTGFDIPVPTLLHSGTATRIGDSNRFHFVHDDDGDDEQIVLCGLIEVLDPTVAGTPIIAWNLFFPSRSGAVPPPSMVPTAGTALGASSPDNPSASLSPAALIDLWFGGESDFIFDVGPLVGSQMPATLVEVTPA
jgi:hypothetical protein